MDCSIFIDTQAQSLLSLQCLRQRLRAQGRMSEIKIQEIIGYMHITRNGTLGRLLMAEGPNGLFTQVVFRMNTFWISFLSLHLGRAWRSTEMNSFVQCVAFQDWKLGWDIRIFDPFWWKTVSFECLRISSKYKSIWSTIFYISLRLRIDKVPETSMWITWGL